MDNISRQSLGRTFPLPFLTLWLLIWRSNHGLGDSSTEIYHLLYTKAYEMPERHKGGIHLPDWKWKTGGTEEDFLKRSHHHNIPLHIIDIIWDSMITLPKASLVRTELPKCFSSPPTFSEFTKSIGSRPGKTKRGMSGLSYFMMKAWSNDFKQLVYQLGCSLGIPHSRLDEMEVVMSDSKNRGQQDSGRTSPGYVGRGPLEMLDRSYHI